MVRTKNKIKTAAHIDRWILLDTGHTHVRYIKQEHIKLSMNLTKHLVAIHAHVCGDGNMYLKVEKRSPSAIRTGRTTKPFKRYIIEYTNTRPELLDHMTKHIKRTFPKTYVYRDDKKHRIQARNKTIFQIMRNLEYQDGSRWVIPEEIIENTEFRRIWLRAFFDDEGSVYKSAIAGYNTNREAILTIAEMLKLEGMETKITFRLPKYKKYKICYTIRIGSSYFTLFKHIGFNHKIKKKKYNLFYKIRMRRRGCVRSEIDSAPLNPDKRLGRPLFARQQMTAT